MERQRRRGCTIAAHSTSIFHGPLATDVSEFASLHRGPVESSPASLVSFDQRDALLGHARSASSQHASKRRSTVAATDCVDEWAVDVELYSQHTVAHVRLIVRSICIELQRAPI